MSEYREELLDPRWQKKKAEIFTRDKYACQVCGRKDITLHAHHRYYTTDTDPWDYPDSAIITLCEVHHNTEHLVGKLLTIEDLIDVIRDNNMMINMISQLSVLIEKSETFESDLRLFLRDQVTKYFQKIRKGNG